MAMIQRCTNPNHKEYPRYGGRGITVCDRWLEPNGDGFLAFLYDLGSRPANPEGWTSRVAYWWLDRIDNEGNYEPGNVRWASPSQSALNRRPREVTV
jgi:hypothetical protein